MDITIVQRAEPDEFGICDGRDLARALIAHAFSLIVPYAQGCPRCADMIFSAIANETMAELHAEAEEEGGLPCALFSIHMPGPQRRMLYAAHLEVSTPETLRLLKQFDTPQDR